MAVLRVGQITAQSSKELKELDSEQVQGTIISTFRLQIITMAIGKIKFMRVQAMIRSLVVQRDGINCLEKQEMTVYKGVIPIEMTSMEEQVMMLFQG